MRLTQLAIWLHLVADDEVSIRGPLLSNGLEKTDYQLNQSIAEPHLKIMADLSDAEKTMADLSDTETVARDKKGRDSGRCFRHSPGKLSVSDQILPIILRIVSFISHRAQLPNDTCNPPQRFPVCRGRGVGSHLPRVSARILRFRTGCPWAPLLLVAAAHLCRWRMAAHDDWPGAKVTRHSPDLIVDGSIRFSGFLFV
jgi:hypothetical protein